jgi:L-iditol 2-dehydrogenase
VEAVSVAAHAVGRTPLAPGACAAVLGAGMIGLLVVQVLRAAGCGRVIAIDLDDGRLGLARRLGATAALRADLPGLAGRVAALCDGRGADAVFEVVGVAATIKAAVECARKGGSVTLVGNAEPTVDLPLQSVVTRQITLIGSCASAGEYPACLDLIASGKVNVTDFISAESPLEDAAQWFERLHSREKGLMKVLVTP